MTKVLVGLYEEPEKPGGGFFTGNVNDFLKKSLGAPDLDIDTLNAENRELLMRK